MLYDGAIRFATQARDALQAKEIEQTHNLLTRAQRIIVEMQNGLRPEIAPDVCKQMASLYDFVYRRLIEANVNKDMTALDESIQILNHMRETWILLMERLRQERSTASAPGPQTQGDPDAVAVGGFGAGRITRLVSTTSPRSSYIVRVIQRCTHRARDTECLMTRMPAVLLITTLAVTAVTAADAFAQQATRPAAATQSQPVLTPEQWMAKGDQAAAGGDYAAAANAYGKAFAADPGNLNAGLAAADSCLRSQNLIQARELYDTCLKLNPNDWRVHFGLGTLYLQRNYFQTGEALPGGRRATRPGGVSRQSADQPCNRPQWPAPIR